VPRNAIRWKRSKAPSFSLAEGSQAIAWIGIPAHMRNASKRSGTDAAWAMMSDEMTRTRRFLARNRSSYSPATLRPCMETRPSLLLKARRA
jgi:hypothetical protein